MTLAYLIANEGFELEVYEDKISTLKPNIETVGIGETDKNVIKHVKTLKTDKEKSEYLIGIARNRIKELDQKLSNHKTFGPTYNNFNYA